MAEVEFGDSELFQQLEDSAPRVAKHIQFTYDEEDQEDEKSQLRSRLEECDDYIERLTEENKGLRRKLSILARPSNITIENANVDGPVLQILYANSSISKQCRQEIEDCICSVIVKHQKPSNGNKPSICHMKPQNSAFAMDEDSHKSLSSSRRTADAFKVVGSVLYFTSFSLDKLGQPLVNENPQLTDGWDVPTYNQVFGQVVGTDGQEIEMRDKRPKSLCFNCGLSGHQLRDCPKPKDMAAINERRKEFNQNNNQATPSNQRYHADQVEERFAKYKPGVMSEELLTALGIDGNTLPPLIYRMRQLGYPPGWLKEAEMENSGLTLYDGNVSKDGNIMDSTNLQNISYDVSKLIDFPGFNTPAPNKMKDEFIHYGSVPMQYNHMKQNYAAYLSSNFPTSSATCSKRRHESDSSPQKKKKIKSSPDGNSDMDIESDPGTPYRHDFHFQPPLPPGSGSPCFSSPPPVPQGTPPSTPTPPPLPKGTPPPTPTNGSPALRGRNWVEADETAVATEDDLTLEELEEQQRLIWAALEKAESATNSDCETPAMGTPAPSSPSVSTSAHVDSEMEEVEETMDTIKPAEMHHGHADQKESGVQEICSQEPGLRKDENSPQSPEPVKATDESPQSPGPVKCQGDDPQSPDRDFGGAGDCASPEPVGKITAIPERSNSAAGFSPFEVTPGLTDPVPEFAGAGDCASPEHAEKVAAVPHRSNFAAGIVPFEDTPEFTEVAEATGTYLKIRDLLKSSQRNLIRKK